MKAFLQKKVAVLRELDQNNQGFTLVELLVSVLAFVFVSAAVMQMMLSGANIHAQVTEKIRVETQAQIALGLMEEYAVDAGNLVGFDVDSGSGYSTFLVINNRDFDVTTTGTADSSFVHVFRWDSVNERIEYNSSKATLVTKAEYKTNDEGDEVLDKKRKLEVATPTGDWETLVEYVVGFEVDFQEENDRVISLGITFDMDTGREQFEAVTYVALRNRLDVGDVDYTN